MTTVEDVNEKSEEKRRAEERNPLLKLTLGELVREMQVIVTKDPNVLTTPEVIATAMQPLIPSLRDFRIKESMINYEKYTSIIKELDRREEEYKSYKPEPRY